MSAIVPPVLDARNTDAFASELLARVPAYVPGWVPATGGAGTAMAYVYGRLLERLADIIDQAPNKNELACFDQLGLELLPAQAARAPVVFTSILAVGDSTIPAGSQVGATVPGMNTPLTFQTEQAIALASAKLVQAVSLWPERDAYTDHSSAMQRGNSFTLFEDERPVRHEFYVGDELILALAGKSHVELKIELATPSSAPLDIEWEYWDGDIWRDFKSFVPAAGAATSDSVDGTAGLTRDGTIRLASDCAKTVDTDVDHITSRWLRGRIAAPLLPVSGAVLPEIRALSVGSVIDRSLPTATCKALKAGEGIQPDSAYADQLSLDLTKSIQPLGPRPQIGTTFYLSCDEVMTKGGADVTICFRHVKTPDETADAQGAAFKKGMESATQVILKAAIDNGQALVDDAYAILQLTPDLTQENTLVTAIFAFQDAMNPLYTATDLTGLATYLSAAKTFVTAIDAPTIGLPDFLGPWSGFSSYFDELTSVVQEVAGLVDDSATQSTHAVDELSKLTSATAAGAGGATLPSLATPVVDWEYWNGGRWASLGASGAADALNLTADGPVTFTVPEDAASVHVNGTDANWIRARVRSGGYGIVQTVTWTDSSTGLTNVFPIILIRPPVIENVALGYEYHSPVRTPDHCIAYNDFQYADLSDDLHTTGSTVAPYAYVADQTPALYLGFNRPLPANLIGLYLAIEQVAGQIQGPDLVWECWSGSDWIPLVVDDETQGLALPGIVSLLYPGVPPLPTASVTSAQGTSIQVTDPVQAAAFAPGDVLSIAGSNGVAELATLDSVKAVTLTVTAPLSQSYSGATVGIAPLPRFGTPATWVRARLAHDQSPLTTTIDSLSVNAVWATQERTVQNEILGSSIGEAGQVFFFSNTPVLPGEVLEICELTAPRASVEESMFRAELEAAGVSPSDIRSVADPRTGETTAIWVRWHEVPTLLFAGPNARAYALERSSGQVTFGGGGVGLTPVAGTDNVSATTYETGGGVIGNVSAGTITQILAGVPASAVTNPRAGEGGADGESLDRVTHRAPRVIRCRLQAITAADYEAMAIEASPAVAVARALPTTDPNGRFAPGWVSVVIVPQSVDPEPVPSFGLKQEVQAYIAARAPAQVATQVVVEGPMYLEIGVSATLAPLDPSDAATVLSAATASVAAFLHPLTGGPDGDGWPFGRGVFRSDVAALLAGIPGVDYVSTLTLLVNGAPQGESVAVPPDRLVSAGPILLSLAG